MTNPELQIVFQVAGIQNSFDVVALDDIRFDRVNGHLQIHILSSESSQISILTTTGLDEELIWVQDGKFAGPGWNSVRIPLR
ncbi:unnamed protein product, partial [Mesorhabditis spiculigera]